MLDSKKKSQRAASFVPLDVAVQIAQVQQERGTVRILDNGQLAALNEPPELPRAYAEVLGGFLGSQEPSPGNRVLA